MADEALPTLLSRALVAFTIELDNEFEHRSPHRTTVAGASGHGSGPWLTSLVMWANVLRYVDPAGVSVGELHARARTTRDSLTGLVRWGYVTVGPRPDDGRDRVPRDELMVRTTRRGEAAQEVWRPLDGVIEERWTARFGAEAVGRLRDGLADIASRTGLDLPRYLPMVVPTQNGRSGELLTGGRGPGADDVAPVELSTLLARVLLAFTLDFERATKVSLPISANTLRVLDGAGVPVRELPPRTGVSKEANAMAVGFLVRHGCAELVAAPPPGRGRLVRLTTKGLGAQRTYRRVLAGTEKDWVARYGRPSVDDLRRSLEALQGDPGDSPTLRDGLTPYPDGWRARVRPLPVLPHYPMVLHRGGYPDGS